MGWAYPNMCAALCTVLMASSAPAPAKADLWSGFYKTAQRAVQVRPNQDQGCIAAILNAQESYQIPDNLLLAIGIQEAGRQVKGEVTVWPWSVNAEGKGMFFRTKEQAIGWVRAQQAQGVRSIDVGCMQINLHWHKGAFSSLEEAFDPIANAQYAARFLADLKRSSGTWWGAAGSYHSRTEEHRSRYLAALGRNHKVANAEYERFTGIARHAGRRLASAQLSKLPAPPVLWGDTAEAQTAFSIYSRQPLVPVLPTFREVSGDDE